MYPTTCMICGTKILPHGQDSRWDKQLAEWVCSTHTYTLAEAIAAWAEQLAQAYGYATAAECPQWALHCDVAAMYTSLSPDTPPYNSGLGSNWLTGYTAAEVVAAVVSLMEQGYRLGAWTAVRI